MPRRPSCPACGNNGREGGCKGCGRNPRARAGSGRWSLSETTIQEVRALADASGGGNASATAEALIALGIEAATTDPARLIAKLREAGLVV